MDGGRIAPTLARSGRRPGMLRSLAPAALAMALGIGALSAPPSARAQTFPDRPITFIVPYAAGSLADLISRALGNELTRTLKQPIIVDNKPGSGQVIGATALARAPANGYTIMLMALPTVIGPAVQKSLPYAGNTDFTAVANLLTVNMLLVVNPANRATSLDAFIAAMKANPGKYMYGSVGVGSPIHLFAEAFSKATATSAVHVPYRVFTNTITDIMQGQIEYGFMPASTMQHVVAGKLKTFGISALARDPEYPDVPTLDEQGIKGFQAGIPYTVVTTKGTPTAALEKLNGAINAAIVTEGFISKVKPIGGVTLSPPLTLAQAAAFLAQEDDRWQRLVKERNVVLE